MREYDAEASGENGLRGKRTNLRHADGIRFPALPFQTERRGRIQKELLEQVWEYQAIQGDVRVSDDLVKRLRKKLRLQNATAVIETVWGYGYRLSESRDRRNL